ncbi:MAG: Gx transporter family protein [Clostridia bacterium]|nr:Gx transporter family protein [Clostridia bacterium]
MKTGSKTTVRLTLLAVFAAMTMALSALENALPPLPVPGARMGLSNIAVTAGMWLISPASGWLLGAVKVGFTLFTRGATAAIMAGAGTCLSVGITAVLLPLYARERLSFIGINIAAATAHTLGQLTAATWWLTPAVWAYAPLLLLTAAATGTVTGLVLNLTLERVSRAIRYTKE